MSKEFALIEMGRVGSSLVRTLEALGHAASGVGRVRGLLLQDLSLELPSAHLIWADAAESRILPISGSSIWTGGGCDRRGYPSRRARDPYPQRPHNTAHHSVGCSLAAYSGTLNLHRKKGLTVLAIKVKGREAIVPRPETPLKEGDMLVVGSPDKELDKLDPSAV